MKRKIFQSIVMFVVTGFVLFCSAPIFAQQNFPIDNDPHKTGLPELTSEDLRVIQETHPRVIKVKLNKMGLERVNQHRKSKKLSLLSPDAIVPQGKEVEVIVGAAPGIRAMPGSDMSVLPGQVDNSALKYFPVIRSQGSLGSCAAFAGAYYAMTYMFAKANDLDAKTGGDGNRLSPKFAYNMVNGGADSGSWYFWVYNLGMKHGIASWAEFPYDTDFRAWPLTSNVWRSAIDRRFQSFGYVANTNTDAGINLVKQMLVDGYVLNYPTYINSWQFKNISNDPSTTEDDAFVGKSAAFWVNGTNGYHAMTVVGYDDTIWVDINSNGTVESAEKGAFRVANSWGTGWKEAGFSWLAYDALKSTSAVPSGPNSGRVMAWSPAQAHYVEAKPAGYTPTHIGEFTLNHLKRNQLKMTLGVSDTAHNTPTTIWNPAYALANAGGAYAFNGTTSPVDGTFVFDFTDIVPATSGNYRFYLGMHDNTLGDTASLKNFKFIDVANGVEYDYLDVPKVIDAAQIYAPVNYSFSNGNVAPIASISAQPTSGYVPLTVEFNGSGSSDPDGTIASYAWDFGDGVTDTAVSISHTYSGVGDYTASLMVTDNLGATNMKTVIISVTENNNSIAAPSNLTATVSGNLVTLTWIDNSTNEAGYYIERAVKGKGRLQFEQIVQIGNEEAMYQESILTPGIYVYRIRAFNQELGMASDYSNQAQAKIR